MELSGPGDDLILLVCSLWSYANRLPRSGVAGSKPPTWCLLKEELGRDAHRQLLEVWRGYPPLPTPARDGRRGQSPCGGARGSLHLSEVEGLSVSGQSDSLLSWA